MKPLALPNVFSLERSAWPTITPTPLAPLNTSFLPSAGVPKLYLLKLAPSGAGTLRASIGMKQPYHGDDSDPHAGRFTSVSARIGPPGAPGLTDWSISKMLSYFQAPSDRQGVRGAPDSGLAHLPLHVPATETLSRRRQAEGCRGRPFRRPGRGRRAAPRPPGADGSVRS